MGRHGNKKKPNLSSKEKLKAIKKDRKLKLKQRRARLIIRNLPFQATEENVREHFAKFGELEDVTVLKKEDGKRVGCAFVQFKLVQKAAKAKHHLNGKPFLDREIEVDFALAKDKYKTQSEVKHEEEEVTVKEEPMESDEVPPKIEDTEDVKTEEEDDSKNNITITGEEDNITDVDDDEEEDQEPPEPTDLKPKFESHDVAEGKTVFIKNVPFAATNDDLKSCMQQFGPLYYALVCVDKYTEHSKGTAFVKFVNSEDAQKALNAGTELTLLGSVLDCHKALDRNEMRQKAAAKSEKPARDSRNLYLVKEGVILAGSKAAEGVSATDMAKRLQLEQYKTQMLRNLNMFVSRERLVVHNLPAAWDDSKFRALMQKNSPKGAVIRESRVMRDLRNVDAGGLGKSKEFGFVAFARHEDALAALRNLNNNPNVFSAARRPIVAFSIENKTMINAKQRRMEKSKLKNPKSKHFDPNVVKADEEKNKRRQTEERGDGDENEKGFAGVAAKPGVQKMRSRYNLKRQASLHLENLKKEKRKGKMAKKTLSERRKDFTKQPRQKVNKKAENDAFSKMVTDYKRKLVGAPGGKKGKWYEGD